MIILNFHKFQILKILKEYFKRMGNCIPKEQLKQINQIIAHDDPADAINCQNVQFKSSKSSRIKNAHKVKNVTLQQMQKDQMINSNKHPRIQNLKKQSNLTGFEDKQNLGISHMPMNDNKFNSVDFAQSRKNLPFFNFRKDQSKQKTMLKVNLNHNISLLGDQDVLDDEDGKYFYAQLNQKQSGYINRKYASICGNHQSQMSFNQFIIFFSHLQYSDSSYEKLFRQFLELSQSQNKSKKFINYEQLKNAIRILASRSAIEIQRFLFKTYFTNDFDYLNFVRESLDYFENKKIKTMRNFNQEKEITHCYAQLETYIRKNNKSQIKQWLKNYVNFGNFRKIFVQRAIKASQLRIREKLIKEEKRNKQKITSQVEYVISNKWLGKLFKYYKNKYGQIKQKKDHIPRVSLNMRKLPSQSNQRQSRAKQYHGPSCQNTLTQSFLKKFKQKSDFESQEFKTANDYPGQIDNSNLMGTFQWELRPSLEKDIDFKVIQKKLYQELQILYGASIKFQRTLSNGNLEMYPIFIKLFQYSKHQQLFNAKQLFSFQPESQIDQLLKVLPKEEGTIHYQRKFGKKWKVLSKNDIGKVGEYFSNTCFLASVRKNDIQHFQAKYLNGTIKQPSIGDIYISRNKEDDRYYKVFISLTTKNSVSYVHPDFKYYSQKTTGLEEFEKSFKKVVIQGISTTPAKQKKVFRAGLQNMGNTCYMNATLQMIIHVRTQNLFNPDKSFGKQFNFISEQLEKQKASLLPVAFKKVVDKNLQYFKGNDQHDAHQFLLNLLNKLELENKKIFQQSFQNVITRVLICKKCNKSWERKDTTPIISLPIKNYDRKQFKIVFDEGNRARNVKFQMSPSGTVGQWKQDFLSAIGANNQKSKFLFAQVSNTNIIRQFNSINQDELFKQIQIRNTDYIVAYKFTETQTDTDSLRLKWNYYICQDRINRKKSIAREIQKSNINGFVQIQIRQNGRLIKRKVHQSELKLYNPTLTKQQVQKSKAVIKFINRNAQYNEAIYYPHVLYSRIDLPIKTLRLQLQKTLGKGHFQLKIVGISQSRLCYFCKQKIIMQKKIAGSCDCFQKNQELYPIEWLYQEVQYVIVWKKAQDYRKRHLKQADIAATSLCQKQMTNLKQSINLFSKKQVIQMECEHCKTKNCKVESWQQIKTPSNKVLIIHLKRFSFVSYQTKIYTKWNLEKMINFCGHFYELKGVILHIGDGSAGHYIAVADQIKYDDQWVDSYSYDKISSGQIYILFYKRISG